MMRARKHGKGSELESASLPAQEGPMAKNLARLESDYEVSGGGSIFILTPLNAAARENLEAGLGDEAQRWAGGVVVEHRYIADLCAQLTSEGWRVS
jgi:hypothetical protein